MARLAQFGALDEYLYPAGQLSQMDLWLAHGSRHATRGWQPVVVFLLTVFTALVLLAAGFLLGVFWLRDEHARLTALREEVGQKTARMKQLAHGDGAAVTPSGAVPPTSHPHQAD